MGNKWGSPQQKPSHVPFRSKILTCHGLRGGSTGGIVGL